MGKAPFNWWLWTKVIGAGAAMVLGGSYVTKRLIPTEEELIARYNPKLKKRALEQREQHEQEFDDFTKTMKASAKSGQNMWIALEEDKKAKASLAKARRKEMEEANEARRQQMRKDAGLQS